MTDANTLANRVAHRARTIPTTVLHLDAGLRLNAATGWPTGGQGRNSGHGDPVTGAVIARTTGTGPGYRPADIHAAMMSALAIADGQFDLIERFARDYGEMIRAATSDLCSGAIRPECSNVASDDGLCLECRAEACTRCHRRPKSGRRSPITGQGCCDACHRADDRAMKRAG